MLGRTIQLDAQPFTVVGATTLIFSIIMLLTHGLTVDLEKLSLLHPPFLLGLITGGAIIYWFSGASCQAVSTGAYRAVEFIKQNIKLDTGTSRQVLRSQYIRTAVAKGLPLHTVILRHAMRPALLPVASYLAPAIASIMTGSLVVESIAGLPGIGRYMVQGALNRDYTLVLGMVIIYSTLLILMGLVVDLLYAWLDPRVRLAG